MLLRWYVDCLLCKKKINAISRWPSQIFNEDGEPCQIQKLVGYRIYVNGHPKGMIKPHKNRALGTVTSVQYFLSSSIIAFDRVIDFLI